jgi:hypothetical protein
VAASVPATPAHDETFGANIDASISATRIQGKRRAEHRVKSRKGRGHDQAHLRRANPLASCGFRVFAERSKLVNPYTNPTSPEPTRMEIRYRLTPEQEQMQRQVQQRVQGMRWLFRAFMVFFLLALVAVLGGIAFVIVQIAATFPH